MNASDPAGNLRDLVIITGMSGAGKSSAMACFEDAGYFCVDNLPPEMIASLTSLFNHEGSKVELAAIVSDARGGSYFEEIAGVVEELKSRETKFQILVLDADDQAIQNRFKETRRRHPLAPQSAIEEGQGLIAMTRLRHDHRHTTEGRHIIAIDFQGPLIEFDGLGHLPHLQV